MKWETMSEYVIYNCAFQPLIKYYSCFIISASLDIFNKSHILDYPSRKNHSSKGQYHGICFRSFFFTKKDTEYQKLVMANPNVRM